MPAALTANRSRKSLVGDLMTGRILKFSLETRRRATASAPPRDPRGRAFGREPSHLCEGGRPLRPPEETVASNLGFSRGVLAFDPALPSPFSEDDSCSAGILPANLNLGLRAACLPQLPFFSDSSAPRR